MLRRAFALLIMSVVGFATAALVASPATAQVNPPINFTPQVPGTVEFEDNCDGTVVVLISGSGGPQSEDYDWSIEVDGDTVEEYPDTPPLSDPIEHEVAALSGPIFVNWENEFGHEGQGWSHEWKWPGVEECGGLDLSIEGDCDTGVAITYVNHTPWNFWGDYRVDNEAGDPDEYTALGNIAGGPHAGKPFGHIYNLTEVPALDSTVVTLEDLSPGSHTVEARIWRGPENDYYIDWITFDVVCETPASPSPTPAPTPSPTTPATGGGGGSDEGAKLPLTGSSTQTLGIAGVGLLALGSSVVGLSVAWNRRRDRNAVDNLVADSAE